MEIWKKSKSNSENMEERQVESEKIGEIWGKYGRKSG
jgi:hypothetical protein